MMAIKYNNILIFNLLQKQSKKATPTVADIKKSCIFASPNLRWFEGLKLGE
jgi:hypothetical protein